MVIKKWLNIEERTINTYDFKIRDAVENSVDEENLIRFCGGELINAVRSSKFLMKVLKDYDLNILSDYVKNNTFAPEGNRAWIGDFGEVLCTTILRDYDNDIIPVYKLRSREKQDWPMRLTDILTYKTENGTIILKFSEVKTRTKSKECHAPKAYEKLQKEMKDSKPEVLDFIQRRLLDEGKYDQADLFMKIYFGKIKPKKHSILFLVYEKPLWDERILINLNKVFDKKDLHNFEVRVIRISELRKLIRSSYECAKNPETLKELFEHGKK